jgi:hypothetical protein
MLATAAIVALMPSAPQRTAHAQQCLVPDLAPTQLPFCIVVEKEVDGDEEFDITVVLPGGEVLIFFAIGDGDEFTVALNAGTTTITEDLPPGWALDADCDTSVATVEPIEDGIEIFLQFDTVAPFVHCIFNNFEVEDEDEEPTRTPTPTPTRTPTRTPTPTATRGPGNLGGPIGSFFDAAAAARDAREGADPTPRPTTAAPAAAAQTVRPPSTGDGGLW